MGIETELKLSLDAKDIPQLLKHPLLATAPKRQKLHNTYFDTPDLALTQQKVAVRERRILRKTILTVKTANRSEGGISQRSEWEAPTSPGRFDFSTLIDDAALVEQLTQLTPSLVPVFTTNFSRRVWTLEFRKATIEVALDQGIISVTQHGIQQVRPICELELELKAGAPETLFALARMLSRQVRLHPADASKAARGYALFLDQPMSPVRNDPILINPDDTTIATFLKIARSCISQLQANEAGINTVENEEYIHQARVALRRLRTALRLFSNALPAGFADRWSQSWRAIAQELGDARNWDVFCAEQIPLLDKDLGAHPDLISLRHFAEQRKLESHESAKSYINSRQYSIQIISFCEALLMLKARQETIKGYATKALKHRHKRFTAGARIAHTLDAEARHEVRIDLKKLRYTLDFFESLFPKKRVQAYSRMMANIQALLGHMNDLATSELLMAERPQAAMDTPTAWAKGRMSAYLDMLPAALKPIIGQPVPWEK
jgi:inorganic triphosphatase YgiF